MTEMKTIFIQKTYKSSRTVWYHHDYDYDDSTNHPGQSPSTCLPKRSWQRTVSLLLLTLLCTTRCQYSYICYVAIFVVYYKVPRNMMSLIMNQDEYQIKNFHPAPRSWTRCTQCATSPTRLSQLSFWHLHHQLTINITNAFQSVRQFDVTGTPWEQNLFRRSWATGRQPPRFNWFV